MSHLFFIILFLLTYCSSFSQRKWDGGGDNEAWNDPLNWVGNSLPTASDDVLLDNLIINGNYRIVLPATAVSVKSITISPAEERFIELILPPENAAMPGLTLNGAGYGLTLNSGGIFRNSSGADSGNPLVVADSIRINNGGRLIHNTARGHAATVERLSAAPGTEKGMMEFDIPDASSTISLSGRNYGTLVFKAVAAGGSLNYTAAGTNTVRIRGDMIIDNGVNLNLNFSDTVFVMGDFKQGDAQFDLGTTARQVAFVIAGNVDQTDSGLITESGSGEQQLLFVGNGLQQINIHGRIENTVALIKDGTGNAVLHSPLSVPYQLILRKGNIISSIEATLTLLAGCTIKADTISSSSIVIGPMRKEGLNNEYCLFPVGYGQQMRWLAITGATGSFTVEYIRSDPHRLTSTTGPGIHHISQLEYWTIAASGGASANLRLSFHDLHSGGVTDLDNLRVAQYYNEGWQDEGNSAIGGSPGQEGWVSSFAASGFSAEKDYFALASAISQENPLPINDKPRRVIANRNDNAQIQLMNTVNVINVLTIRVSVQENKQMKFTISNSLGQIIKKVCLEVFKGTTSLRIPVYGLSPGVYFLSLFEAYKAVDTWKFVKR